MANLSYVEQGLSKGHYVSRPMEKALIKAKVDEILDNHDFGQALQIVKEGLQEHKWLRQAYISFYRGKATVSLFEVSKLDWVNIEIFRLVCNLRNIRGWSDYKLFELEVFAKQIV